MYSLVCCVLYSPDGSINPFYFYSKFYFYCSLAKNKKIETNSGKWLQKIIKIYEQDIKKAVTEK
jgi:hypothetical protein